MPNPLRISLDTNIFIFGIRNIDPFSAIILKNLFRFDIRIPAQVEKELRNNVSSAELREFYDLVEPLSTFEVFYQPSDSTVLGAYRSLGLKTGDAIIAAFCKTENIAILISENRHFLKRLPLQVFEVLDSESFCKRFRLE